MHLDDLDVSLLAALRERPRAGDLELSRVTGVARGTVTARLRRMEDAGVITGHGPEVDVGAAGFGVQAFVTLEIAQGGQQLHVKRVQPPPVGHPVTMQPAQPFRP